MSDNFATKKSVWKETIENNDVLFILPGIIALLGFGCYSAGCLLSHLFQF